MDIQRYTGTRPAVKPMRILTYPPGLYVRILGKPTDSLSLWLHWRGAHSYPCLGESCENCGPDRFPYGYCPVEVGRYTGVQFHATGQAILPVSSEALELCLGNRQGQVYLVNRKGNCKRGQTTFTLLSDDGAARFGPFDVLPHMELVWAWFLRRDMASELTNSVSLLSESERTAIAGRIGVSA